MSRRDPLVLRPAGGALWEYICKSGTGLELDELKALNQEGYIYHSERLEVAVTSYSTRETNDYIDIYLFTKTQDDNTLGHTII